MCIFLEFILWPDILKHQNDGNKAKSKVSLVIEILKLIFKRVIRIIMHVLKLSILLSLVKLYLSLELDQSLECYSTNSAEITKHLEEENTYDESYS